MGQSKLLLFSRKSLEKPLVTRIFSHIVANSSFCTSVNKFGEDKTPTLLALELARIKMENKERIKYFNQRFLTLLNRIPAASQPPEDIIIENYTSALPKSLGMFVKQAS